LPHTIRSYENTLQLLGSNCFVFCRERPSFDFIVRTGSKASVFLAHDVALSCDLKETKKQMVDRWAPDLFDKTLLVRNAKRLVRSVGYRLMDRARAEVLSALRTDVEKTTVEIPRLNIDISQAFAADDMSPASSLHTTYWMMRFIDHFKVVRTNRLHVGIMSAMLAKEVHLLDNSYGKIRDVFDYSLREQFANVNWHPDIEHATA
jgi:exopolysaccharide biosynthesis predicted pyruvyltransferase EpsI